MPTQLSVLETSQHTSVLEHISKLLMYRVVSADTASPWYPEFDCRTPVHMVLFMFWLLDNADDSKIYHVMM